jgi:hypothetical protein
MDLDLSPTLRYKKETGSVVGMPPYDPLTNKELLELGVTVLFLGFGKCYH